MKIEVNNLSKDFKGVSVLKNINVVFDEGKIYGLVGKNGSGKSVFLKILCNLYSPSGGEVLYDGKNIYKENTFPPSTRALIEKPTFLPDLTGFENLKLLASIQNIISDEKINDTLKNVNLYLDKDKKYKYYSLGMKQKLGIAQVLMENPKVIILDEPFNGIEDDTVNSLRKILKKEAKDGKIVILASHIKDDIDFLSDEVYYFDNCTIKRIK